VLRCRLEMVWASGGQNASLWSSGGQVSGSVSHVSRSQHLQNSAALRVVSGPGTVLPEGERDLLGKLTFEQLLKVVQNPPFVNKNLRDDMSICTVASELNLVDCKRKPLSPQQLSFRSVLVHVYNLNDSFVRPNQLLAFSDLGPLGGAFHAGIEVFRAEWAYGVSGVNMAQPRTNSGHVYQCSVLIGEIEMSQTDFASILHTLCQEWRGLEYDVLTHNCCTFSRLLLEELDLRLPSWIDRLARGLAAGKEAGHKIVRGGKKAAHMTRRISNATRDQALGIAAALRNAAGFRDESGESESEDSSEESTPRGQVVSPTAQAARLGYPTLRQAQAHTVQFVVDHSGRHAVGATKLPVYQAAPGLLPQAQSPGFWQGVTPLPLAPAAQWQAGHAALPTSPVNARAFHRHFPI